MCSRRSCFRSVLLAVLRRYGWLLEEDAKTFFELKTDGKHQSQEVDFLAAKVYGYVRVYFQCSFKGKLSVLCALVGARLPGASVADSRASS